MTTTPSQSNPSFSGPNWVDLVEMGTPTTVGFAAVVMTVHEQIGRNQLEELLGGAIGSPRILFVGIGETPLDADHNPPS